ncbi:AI-2E family transporter [Paraurantiacibacter namhicola]|uniref:AI-2 transport protein TqsA n=1 Tax=Paraurantiacibacter namhicola TaxID=645517 RepID=A0A1C7D7I4_9SPHN|nr:AI-2E family transporter [Paraurantiacibacter namhicola]ANU07405.1 AI-2 transport protein TqsA [Paraurantiacibacter namhicola]
MTDKPEAQENHDHDGEEPLGASPTYIESPKLRFEAQRALIWVAVVGIAMLAVYISQSLLVIFGALVFAAMIDGGARLLERVLPVGRMIRIIIVLALTTAFFIWLSLFAGSQISQQAAEFPSIVNKQLGATVEWLQARGFAISTDNIESIAGQLVSGVGTVTKAIGGIFGGLATLFLIMIIGIYIAVEPRLYERGVEWMVPKKHRSDLLVTLDEMAFTMRRLMAGRLVGMLFEGIFTWAMLAWYGVPMAALLGILTGLLAFIPNIGAVISGVLMVLVGFSGGTDMGLYTIFVYFLVQVFDGYVVIPLIAKKTVDLAPALVLGAQLIFGILFGILGLFLADPLMAMLKVALERRSETAEEDAKSKTEGQLVGT